jgi:catechol 2,3-dioxygenase-like lactoylglutathione lyase family enzyme
MKIERLNHVALHVNDLEATRHFYGELLGLQPKARPDFSFDGAWYALGPTQELHIITGREETPVARARSNHFALQVASIEASAEFLRNKGVEFIGPKDRPDGAKQIFIEDPDGHFVELTEL